MLHVLPERKHYRTYKQERREIVGWIDGWGLDA